MERSSRSRRIGAFAVSGLIFAFVGVLTAAPAAADFEGECTPGTTNPEDGTCVLDEPEGTNPDTYGTVTYDREVTATDDTLTFDFPDGLDISEVQICLTLVDDSSTNPYVPTDANTCAGSSADRAYVDTTAPFDPAVGDVDDFFAGDPDYELGDGLWFAVHVDAFVDDDDRTLYVVGSSVFAPPPTFSLTVTKDVVSDTEAEVFAFEVDCGTYALSTDNNADTAITYTDGDAHFDLGDEGSMTLSGIPEDTECTISETAPATPGGDWTTTIEGTEDADRSTTVTLDEDQTVDFVNTFEEVLVTVVTTTTAPPPPPPPPAPETEVLGVQIQRQQLPRTGLGETLTLLGLALVGSGGLLLVARRRLAVARQR